MKKRMILTGEPVSHVLAHSGQQRRPAGRADRSRTLRSRSCHLTATSVLALIILVILSGCSSSGSDTESTATSRPLVDAEWLAFQDGDGVWQEMDMPETGIFIPTVNDSQGRYGIAYLLADGTAQRVTLYTLQTTIDELPQIDMREVTDNTPASLRVTVEAPQNPDPRVKLFVSNEEDWISSFPFTSTYTVGAGAYDLIATQTQIGLDYPGSLIARRELDLSAGTVLEQTITTADFDGSQALTGPYSITVQGDGGVMDASGYTGKVLLTTGNHTEVEMGYKGGSGASLQYTALPDALVDGDTYILRLAIDPDDTHEIHYYEGFAAAGDKSATPPSQRFDAAFVADTSSGSLLPGMTDIPASDSGHVIGYTVQYRGAGNSIDYRTLSHISGARIQTATSFTMPDLTDAEGWDANWSIPVDSEDEYSVTSVQLASDSSVLDIIALWYFNGVIHLDDGKWFASLTEAIAHGEEAAY